MREKQDDNNGRARVTNELPLRRPSRAAAARAGFFARAAASNFSHAPKLCPWLLAEGTRQGRGLVPGSWLTGATTGSQGLAPGREPTGSQRAGTRSGARSLLLGQAVLCRAACSAVVAWCGSTLPCAAAAVWSLAVLPCCASRDHEIMQQGGLC